MILYGRELCCRIKDVMAVISFITYICVDASKSAHIPQCITEIQILVSVSVVSPVNEMIGVLQENQVVQRLYEFLIVFCQYCLYETSIRGLVHIQMQMFLAPVKDLDEHIFIIRTPRNIGKILVISEIVYVGVMD